MEPVQVQKSVLIERIRENRDSHAATYARAMAGYRRAAIKELNEKIDKLEAGGSPDLWIRLPIPEDHTRDYDIILDMLEMSTPDEVHVSFKDFRSYVRDEWDWTERFETTNSSYITQ